MSSSLEPAFHLREYRPADFAPICNIDRVCFPEGIAYTPEEIACGLLQRGAFAIVAEVRGQVIAFILAYGRKRNLGHIITIDVLPEFRSMGIGKELMAAAEQRLRKTGVGRVVLEVSVDNQNAIRFYESFGYVKKRTLLRYYADGGDAYLMEKAWSE